jgi:hypothetical protein
LARSAGRAVRNSQVIRTNGPSNERIRHVLENLKNLRDGIECARRPRCRASVAVLARRPSWRSGRGILFSVPQFFNRDPAGQGISNPVVHF